MREKIRCVKCNKVVEVVDLISHKEYDDQIFSCVHSIKLIKHGIEETASVTDEIKATAIEHRYGQQHRGTEE